MADQAETADAEPGGADRGGAEPVQGSSGPRDFLITYSSRVGSSALVETLQHLPGVFVPLFEELDWYYLDQHRQLDRWNDQNIHEAVLDALHRRPEGTPPDQPISGGFKWRIWGAPDKLAAAFARHRILLFNLVRSDLLEMISSRYLTDVVHAEFNGPQFRYVDSAEQAEKAEILARYRTTRVVADIARFHALCAEVYEAERLRIDLLRRLNGAGVEVWTIFYEDFAYKRFRFLNRLLGLLGHPGLASLPVIGLTKISSHYPSESFENRGDLLRDPTTGDFLRRWETLLYDSGLKLLLV